MISSRMTGYGDTGSTDGADRARAEYMVSSPHLDPAILDYLAQRKDFNSDPAFEIQGVAPNMGEYSLPHLVTFQAMIGSYSKTYLPNDEAMRHSWENARYMRNDVGIMECLEARQRLTAMLDWHLEPEDPKSTDQRDLCVKMERILKRIKRFVEYRRSLLEAIWYGRSGIQHRWGFQQIGGQMYCMPTPRAQDDPGWRPIHGDKLVWRFDDGQRDHVPDQMGIRVAHRQPGSKINDRWTVVPTGHGLAYFMSAYERSTCAIHKHMIEDGAWEDVISSGSIHGVGIRSRIYWEYVQKQEALAFLMEFLERSAGGIEIWEYPVGDKQAKIDVQKAAQERISNQRNIVFFPKPSGEDASLFNMQIVEPSFQGADILKDIIERFFGHRIKRYILGQTLSSEAEATGLGSGVADLHYDTLQQIVKYDATNLEETLTDELVRNVQLYNFPSARNVHIRFAIETETPDMDKKLEAYQAAWQMGARIKEGDVLDMIGADVPKADDNLLQSPGGMQQDMAQAGGNGWMPGMDIGGDTDRDGVVNEGEPDEGPAYPHDHRFAALSDDDMQQFAKIGDRLYDGANLWRVADKSDRMIRLEDHNDGNGRHLFIPIRDMMMRIADRQYNLLDYAKQEFFDWQEHDHPRSPKGSKTGGQFRKKSGGTKRHLEGPDLELTSTPEPSGPAKFEPQVNTKQGKMFLGSHTDLPGQKDLFDPNDPPTSETPDTSEDESHTKFKGFHATTDKGTPAYVINENDTHYKVRLGSFSGFHGDHIVRRDLNYTGSVGWIAKDKITRGKATATRLADADVDADEVAQPKA